MTTRILIAEDNPDLQRIFAEVFIHAEFEVTTVSNGAEAQRQLSSTLPDMLILDINMPEVSGLDVIEYMRQQDILEQVHVIIVTGNDLIARYVDLSAADLVLLKPVEPLTLVSLAKRFLQ
ncbi:MAG: response regulator [Anaerolineae bacterium]|nr:response regulator [Anaerolineae bacterium]